MTGHVCADIVPLDDQDWPDMCVLTSSNEEDQDWPDMCVLTWSNEDQDWPDVCADIIQ